MPVKDYYATLGVAPTADIEVVRAAYRALAKKYHPDSHGNEKHIGRFRDISEAYEILSNAERRRAYDELLKPAVNRQRAPNKSEPRAAPPKKTKEPPSQFRKTVDKMQYAAAALAVGIIAFVIALVAVVAMIGAFR